MTYAWANIRMTEQTPRRRNSMLSAMPLSGNRRDSPRRQLSNNWGLSSLAGAAAPVIGAAATGTSATGSEQPRSAPSRKCSMPAVTCELRNLIQPSKESSTASFPAIMSMMAATAGAGANQTGGQAGQPGVTNFAEMFAQQFFNKQLDADLVAGEYLESFFRQPSSYYQLQQRILRANDWRVLVNGPPVHVTRTCRMKRFTEPLHGVMAICSACWERSCSCVVLNAKQIVGRTGSKCLTPFPTFQTWQSKPNIPQKSMIVCLKRNE